MPRQLQGSQQRVTGTAQMRPSQQHIAPGPAPTTRVQYTAPTGLAFVYQDHQLCFLDRPSNTSQVLQKAIAPPTTGLRAQFIWGAQACRSTAAVPAVATCPSSDSRFSDGSVGQGCVHGTCLEDMPESVLQAIGQHLRYDCRAPYPYGTSEAAAAAAMLACTGSRAALIIAHAVWALLEPDCVRPKQHVDRLLGTWGAPKSGNGTLQAHSQGSLGGMSKQDKKRRKRKVQLFKRKQRAALRSLCTLADPLQCPLSTAVKQLLSMRHRQQVSQRLLAPHGLRADLLPEECGIKASMQYWLKTGTMEDGQLGATAAVKCIVERCSRLAELRDLPLPWSHRPVRCMQYVLSGKGTAEEAIDEVLCLVADEAEIACEMARRDAESSDFSWL